MHVDAKGTRLWFDVDGAALVPDGVGMRARPTVVLLHGGPGSFDHSYLKPVTWSKERNERAGIVNPELNVKALPLLAGFDALDQVGAITCPTLVCTGALDPVARPDAARELADGVRGARLEVLADAGHFPWKDVPDRYWALLLDFVGKAGARGSVM